jgi:tripartite ATP-independent transporter DctM subunit
MVKNGYSRAFSAAVTSASSAIGPIIPPSILMVIYGAMGNVSIGRLFLAGAIPGVIMAIYLMGATFIISRRRNYGALSGGINFSEIYHSFVGAVFPLMIPAIIVGGILGGIFTATESGAIALLYLFIVAPLRIGGMRLTWKGFITALNDTISILGAVMFIVAAACLFGWVLNAIRVGPALSSLLLSISENPIAVLLMINVVVLILGFFIETVALLILLTPIFVPIIINLGIDPVLFGVVLILNLMIGLNTPPVGISMFVATSIAKVSIEEFFKEAWPFLIALFMVLLLLVALPDLVMIVPNWLLPVK